MVTSKQEKKGTRKAKPDDLWSRVQALAEKEDVSYLVAIEKCVKAYWNDHGLTKES